MQDLNDMLYFAEVVERGGFAAAGRALGIPKSRLSRRVSDLETQLGVRLLQRTTRKLSLTEVGEAYLRHCQAMRESAQAAADTVAQVQTTPRGTIRVSCPVTLAQTVVAELMPRFLAQYPEVRIDMLVSNRAVNLVEEGIDVALRVRFPPIEDSELAMRVLCDSPRRLVACPELVAPLPQPLAPADAGTRAAQVAYQAAETASRAFVGQTVAAMEQQLILDTLTHCLGNRTHAATILGISIRTLRNKLNEYRELGVEVF